MSFIGYPSAFLYPRPEQMSSRKSVEHYPWGYWITTTSEKRNGFVKVKDRWRDKKGTLHKFCWIREQDIQSNRILEVNFVDIGQGDGSFLVFPDDQRMLIDAGESDNIYRFLRWRFNRKNTYIENAIISHPDLDHYFGYLDIANDPKFSFGNIFHNGIVERTGKNSLGPRTSGKGSLLTDIIESPELLDRILDDPTLVGSKRYPNLLKDMRDSGRVDAIWMLHNEDRFVPGYGPGEDPHGIVIEVLGPVVQRRGGRLRLPWFGSKGKTKNGHSVVLRLHYGHVTMLLGGDLNIPSEHYLLEHYTGLEPHPETIHERNELISAARQVLECDVMKACHHGSADIEDLFVEAVNPSATVISSGDAESHCHPRPDAIGVYGKFGRGRRPLIFSTELARSTSETSEMPSHIQSQINELAGLIASDTTASEKKKARKKIKELISRKERAVAVYGMITARTDGNRMIMTQKLEAKRSSTGEKWDIHRFEPGADGRLRYQAKH